jgi:hypothetical protein
MRKFVNILPKALNTIHSTTTKIIYTFQICNIWMPLWSLFEIKYQFLFMSINNPLRCTLCKSCIKIGWKTKDFKFWNRHISASFGQYYLGNSRIDEICQHTIALKSIHLTKTKKYIHIEIGWKIQILYSFQICEILEFGPFQTLFWNNTHFLMTYQ